MENGTVEFTGDNGSWISFNFDPEASSSLPLEVAVNSGNKKATQVIYLDKNEIVELSNAFRRFRQAA